MEWVQANIRSFGGDPTRVLLAGESAGAGAVAAHTVMPKSFGHFSRAGLQSGGYSVWDAHGLKTTEKTYAQLAKLLCPGTSPNVTDPEDPQARSALASGLELVATCPGGACVPGVPNTRYARP